MEREKGAALRLQCWQRLITSKALRGLLAMKKRLRQVQELNAAKTIQQVGLAKKELTAGCTSATVILHRLAHEGEGFFFYFYTL